MPNQKLTALLLALCLLAGCWKETAPETSSTPPDDPPPESASQTESPAPENPPEEEKPQSLAGAILYYTPGNRLTLYAMEPETGVIRTVREEDFWNGREVESVSPSGNRLLLSSWDGAPSRRVVALSLYDIDTDRLINLSRTIEGPYGEWTMEHWFPGYAASYRFVDENTFYYTGLCSCGEEPQPHLHRYRIGADGQAAASFLPLEYPLQELCEDSCILLPEKGQALCLPWTGNEWLTWDLDTGKLLSQTPGKNGTGNGCFADGVFYSINSESEAETFQLTAYHMDTDTKEVLAAGRIPKTPGMEDGSWDGRGVLEFVWVEDVRDDGILIRSRGEGCLQYREALWEPGQSGPIDMGEPLDAPAFPVDPAKGYISLYTGSPLPGEIGMYLPLPPEMAGHYQGEGIYGRPYPLAYLSTGELLFLAE